MPNLTIRLTSSEEFAPREIDLAQGLFDGGWLVGGQATQDFLRAQGVLEARIPSHLYHYTTAAGFHGIVSSGAMWASNYSYMNDYLETNYLFSLIQRELRDLVNSGTASQFVDMGLTEDRFGPSVQSCFICSFSENADQLSQWRGYAEGGYSLGVPRSALEKVRSDHGFHIARCIYDEDVARNVAAHLAKLLVDQVSMADTKKQAEKLLFKHRAFAWRISPFFKHPAFSEENEWRIFKFEKHFAAGISRRPSKVGLISYVNVPIFSCIPVSGVSTPVDELRIVCSPGLSSAREIEEPSRLVFELQNVRSSSCRSAIPYRTR